MCNLYSLTPKRDDIGRFFRVSHNRSVAFEPVNAIFPRHVAPVVRHAPDGEREIVLMSWGFLRLEKGRAPKPVTNVRDDQIQTNPFWRDSFKQRRCLVPAGAFCEPNGDVKPATWHWFALTGGADEWTAPTINSHVLRKPVNVAMVAKGEVLVALPSG